jgi:hypothetical protein
MRKKIMSMRKKDHDNEEERSGIMRKKNKL